MDILNNIYPLHADSIKEIEKRSKRISLLKNEVLIHSESNCDQLFF